jgi:hypothetical protein
MATCTFPQTTRANQGVRAQTSVRRDDDALEMQGRATARCDAVLAGDREAARRAGSGLQAAASDQDVAVDHPRGSQGKARERLGQDKESARSRWGADLWTPHGNSRGKVRSHVRAASDTPALELDRAYRWRMACRCTTAAAGRRTLDAGGSRGQRAAGSKQQAASSKQQRRGQGRACVQRSRAVGKNAWSGASVRTVQAVQTTRSRRCYVCVYVWVGAAERMAGRGWRRGYYSRREG